MREGQAGRPSEALAGWPEQVAGLGRPAGGGGQPAPQGARRQGDGWSGRGGGRSAARCPRRRGGWSASGRRMPASRLRSSLAGDLASGRRQSGGRGGQESRSGRRLGNIAVIMPPPWLRNMLTTAPTAHRLSKSKKIATICFKLGDTLSVVHTEE